MPDVVLECPLAFGVRSRMPTPNETTVLEEAYFHISNGGLTLKVVQDPAYTGSSRFNWTMAHLTAEMNSFGVPLEVSIPLGSPEIVYWLHEVMGRLLGDMCQQPNSGRYFHFGDPRMGPGSDIHPGSVQIENGQACKYNYTCDEAGVHYQ